MGIKVLTWKNPWRNRKLIPWKCRIFGHFWKSGWYGSILYLKAEKGTTDNIGRHHIRLFATCDYCNQTSQIAYIHQSTIDNIRRPLGTRSGPKSLKNTLLEEAVFRLKDLMEGDDAQAYKEANKFLDKLIKFNLIKDKGL